MKFDHQDDGLIIMAAVRYAMGRQTYMPSTVVDWCIAHLDQIDDGTKRILKRDLEAEFARLEHYELALGAPCDRAQWQRLLDRLMEAVNDDA